MFCLSKSKYLAGLKCSKLLWFHYRGKEHFPPTDESTQAIFDQGHEVGKLAHRLFPGGVEIEVGHHQFAEIIRRSRDSLKLRKPLFEAGFQSGNAFARADILNPVGKDQWDIIEVKSATSVKDVNLDDLALQRYAFAGAGLRIRKCCLLYINNKYVRQGDIQPRQFFIQKDCTVDVSKRLRDTEKNLERMETVLRLKSHPDIAIGPHCNDPYECPLQHLCWKDVPEDGVFSLAGIREKRAFEWFNAGFHRLTDLPDDAQFTHKQMIQIEAVRSQRPVVDANGIRTFLASLKYPLHFLDFETFSSAIPLVENCSPYQQVPFQYSLHAVEREGAKANHHAFLAQGAHDPRMEFLERLASHIGKRGSIVAYNAGFEKRCLCECCDLFPKFKPWLKEIENRIVDLLDPFRSFQ